MASATPKGPHWGELVPDTPWAARAREDKRTKERTAPIADEIGWSVSVSRAAAEKNMREAQDYFGRYVKSETGGRYRGEIRGYDADEKGDPSTSGDMRDTWSLTLVEPRTGKVVDFWRFAPLADMDFDYEFIQDLAGRVDAGTMTLASAKAAATENAEQVYTNVLEFYLDSLKSSELFPKAEALGAFWHRGRGLHELSRPRYATVRQHERRIPRTLRMTSVKTYLRRPTRRR